MQVNINPKAGTSRIGRLFIVLFGLLMVLSAPFMAAKSYQNQPVKPVKRSDIDSSYTIMKTGDTLFILQKRKSSYFTKELHPLKRKP